VETSPRTLLVAAGGGGDALAAMMIAHASGLRDDSFAVASFAWERTMFDPRPGPRPAAHFARLRRLGRFNWEVRPGSHLRDPTAQSFLPQLAAERYGRLLLLDAEGGVVGIHRQLCEAIAISRAERLLIVDVGGDLLARGDEPDLSSPTADAMVLAAADGVGIPVGAVVVGMGLDGERVGDLRPSPAECLGEIRHGVPEALSAETARRFAASFAWSPSEATGLAYMVARGWRGTAEIRAGGRLVELDRQSAQIRLFSARGLLRRSRLARDIAGTVSLEQVEGVVRSHGYVPEREIERSARLAGRRSASTNDLASLEAQLLDYSEVVANHSVDYLTIRRIGELLRIDSLTLRNLVERLVYRYPYRLRPPVWTVHDR
jgi:hypothetical protein